MDSPVLSVELAGFRSLIRGPRARELFVAATGHMPVWVQSLHGFSASERSAGAVIELARRRGWPVLVHEAADRPTPPSAVETPGPTQLALW